jgi:Ni,Fe-hydrogenase maturation factor
MVAPVLIFAIGNESRGDDALGPLLLRELDAWLAERRTGFTQRVQEPLRGNPTVGLKPDLQPHLQVAGDTFEFLEDFQLQVEHAMDMKDRRLVLFIDAGMDTPAPYSFYRAQANNEPVLYSHALAPEALLKVYEQFYQEAPPDVFVLCIRGERFELGEELSPSALEHLAQALDFSKKLLQNPEIVSWSGLLSCSDAVV